jgi:polyhydroxyalkanoate synthase
MRDWAAFVHEGHLSALEDHLEAQGFVDSLELQRLFAAMRANDLIWSSVVNHYLLDRPAPPSDLLYWFEDGARIPAAFLKSYNRELLLENRLTDPAGFAVGDVTIDLADIKTPMLVIALKDDHVSAWEAVYRGARHLKAEFVLGGSGHNAGVINPPANNKHGFWTNIKQPADARQWLQTATRHEGSWWPWWTDWLDGKGGGKKVSARQPKNPIEPAPGRYVMMP